MIKKVKANTEADWKEMIKGLEGSGLSGSNCEIGSGISRLPRHTNEKGERQGRFELYRFYGKNT